MTAKAPTPQAISALLKRAGFEKSVNRPSRVKGWPEWCAGYKVVASIVPGCVLVEHRVNSMRLRAAAREAEEAEEAEKRAAYAKAITDAGWTVDTGGDELIVTAGKAEQ